MGPTGSHINIIQVHPTRRCNLRCQHCYSTSGPEYFAALRADVVLEFLGQAREEGYNAVGVSGGEPFTYGDLPRLLAGARAHGYATSVTTNGLLLDERRLARIRDYTDVLAISVDGVPSSHDRMRSRVGAFERMRRQLPLLRAMNFSYGFIFTLTMENLDELAWVAEFAAQEGASLLQVHPLESVGRAREYTLHPPDDLELSYAFIEVAKLQEHFPSLKIQFDAADRSLIEREPWRAFVTTDTELDPSRPLSDFVSPLVLQEDGWIVPIQHGFHVKYAIGRLSEADFRTQAHAWKQRRHKAFAALAQGVWNDVREAPAYVPFTNWYSAIAAGSAAPSQP